MGLVAFKRRGAGFTATTYSVAGTPAIKGIDVRRWLREWLTACAKSGSRPPAGLSPWQPWSMSEERRRELTHGVGMTSAVACRHYSRALPIEFCRRIGWLKPDGEPKDMMARVTMLAMTARWRLSCLAVMGPCGPVVVG
ncbi:MAG: hypothetical protein OXQ84_11600 [bacterium]|nr:hypothetical protein [bacterium]